MTTASGAHFSIGGIQYVAAIDEEPHYHHRFESMFSQTSAIAGEIAKDQLRPEKLLWSLTDFSGGEGALIYYPQNPTQYDVGSASTGTDTGTVLLAIRRSTVAVPAGVANGDYVAPRCLTAGSRMR